MVKIKKVFNFFLCIKVLFREKKKFKMLLWLGSFQICECFVDFRFKLGALLGRKTYVYSVREGIITFPEVSLVFCCNIITTKIK